MAGLFSDAPTFLTFGTPIRNLRTIKPLRTAVRWRLSSRFSYSRPRTSVRADSPPGRRPQPQNRRCTKSKTAPGASPPHPWRPVVEVSFTWGTGFPAGHSSCGQGDVTNSDAAPAEIQARSSTAWAAPPNCDRSPPPPRRWWPALVKTASCLSYRGCRLGYILVARLAHRPGAKYPVAPYMHSRRP